MDIGTIGAFEKFLEWGPLGLAGLMLVLVIFALVLGTITPARERVLKTFMYIGAFCFVIASIAQVYMQVWKPDGQNSYALTLEIIPHDSGTTSQFPAPIVRESGTEIDRTKPLSVKADTTVIVDLLDGVDIFNKIEETVETQNTKLQETQEIVQIQNDALRDAQESTSQLSTEITQLKSAIRATTANSSPTIMPKIEGLGREVDAINHGIGSAIRILP